MRHQLRPGWAAGGLAVALSTVFAATVSAAPQTAAAAVSSVTAAAPRTATGGPTAAGGQRRQLLLINGDRLLAGRRPGGAPYHAVTAAPDGGANQALASLRVGGQTYVVPADALPYLGRGLDPSLFSVSRLLDLRAHGRLPVRVRYAGHVPALPGLTVTSARHGVADGYLTSASARAFGRALARQFAADHARGSYGQDGLFAGSVSVSLPGTLPRQARRPDFPMHTLKVTATNLAGQPDTGDAVIVLNADNSSLFSDPVESANAFFHGTTKFSVPAGHYWAIGVFSQFGKKHRYVGERLAVVPQFTVHRSTTVHLAERSASSQILDLVPRATVPDYRLFTLIRPGPAGPPVVFQWEALDSERVWVSPTRQRPTVGRFQAITTTQLDSPARDAGHPYEYGLGFVDTSGLVPPQTHVVRPALLATVHARCYQAKPSQVQQFMTGGTTLEDELAGETGLGIIFRAPVDMTEYLSADPRLIWTDEYFQQRGIDCCFDTSGGQSDFGRIFTPGQRFTEAWGGFPLHLAPDVNQIGRASPDPVLASAVRTGNMLGLYLTPFSDNQPGDTGSGYLPIPGTKITGQFRIEQNGRVIAHGSALKSFDGIGGAFFRVVRLSRKPSVVRLLLTATRRGNQYPLSVASRTVWAWRSAHEVNRQLPPGWLCLTTFTRSCAAQPLLTLSYAVRGLTLRGSAAPGRQVLRIRAGHLPDAAAARITRATVLVSFNGGKTWHRTRIRGRAGHYTATFTAPRGALVTLRTSAADAAGGSITETVTSAYRVAS